MKKKKVRRYTRREVRRNRIIAFCCLVVLAILLIALVVWGIKSLIGNDDKDRSESSSEAASVSQGSSADETSSFGGSLSEAMSSENDSSMEESVSIPGSSSEASSTASTHSGDPYYESAMPLLVNSDHLMPDDYSPTVVSVGDNYKLEAKAAAAWQDMQAAAWEDGVSLWIISAYRTLERQTELYNEKVEEYKNLGYSEADAKLEAGKWVAVPGTSEHCLDRKSVV